MRELSICEMREKLSNFDQLVKIEGEILVTLQGVPISRLLPLHGSQTRPSRAELRAKTQRLAMSSQTLVRDDRDAR